MLNSMLTCKIHFGSTIPDLEPEAGLEKKSNRKDVESVSPHSVLNSAAHLILTDVLL